jgi:hypothetical protein
VRDEPATMPRGWTPPAPDLDLARANYRAAFDAYVTSWPSEPGHARRWVTYIAAFETLQRAEAAGGER